MLRNPILCVFILIMGGTTYLAYTLNLLGPMMQMSGAAYNQALEIGKDKLRDFLQNNETARQTLSMPTTQDGESIRMDTLHRNGKAKPHPVESDSDI